MLHKANKGANPVAEDLGFGTKLGASGTRFINQDGRFNVDKRGLPFGERFTYFHVLISMSWLSFLGVIISGYIMTNLLFALFYFLAGEQAVGGTIYTSQLEHFLECFFFSTQVFTTVGYGRLNPISIPANAVAALESMVGLLSFALFTGLMYGRFSRPNSKIVFSNQLIVAPYQNDKKALMVRLANASDSDFIDAEIQLLATFNEIDVITGTIIRRFMQLSLERRQVDFLALSWTVVHPLDIDSPFYSFSAKDLEDADLEVIVMLKGYDALYNQQVYVNTSYKGDEIAWGYQFTPTFNRDQANNTIQLDLDKISNITKVEVL